MIGLKYTLWKSFKAHDTFVTYKHVSKQYIQPGLPYCKLFVTIHTFSDIDMPVAKSWKFYLRGQLMSWIHCLFMPIELWQILRVQLPIAVKTFEKSQEVWLSVGLLLGQTEKNQSSVWLTNRWPMVSPQKGLVIQKAFSSQDEVYDFSKPKGHAFYIFILWLPRVGEFFHRLPPLLFPRGLRMRLCAMGLFDNVKLCVLVIKWDHCISWTWYVVYVLY